MKKNISRRHALATLSTALLAVVSQPAAADWGSGWFKGKGVVGSGNIQTQERAASGFTAVDLALPARLELRQGDKEGVQVETDDNLQALVGIVTDGGMLKIRPVDKDRYPQTKTLNIIVFVKNIEKVTVSGSGKAWADKLTAKDLHATVGGSGDIQFKALQADVFNVTIGGSGNVVAAGVAAQVHGKIGGSGSIQVGKLEARQVSIKIGGSGEAEVWAKESLDVSVGGSGDVRYYGDPKINTSIGGSGKVTRLGTTPL